MSTAYEIFSDLDSTVTELLSPEAFMTGPLLTPAPGLRLSSSQEAQRSCPYLLSDTSISEI